MRNFNFAKSSDTEVKMDFMSTQPLKKNLQLTHDDPKSKF